MSLSLTAKEMKLVGSVLKALVKNAIYEWVPSELDLNDYIGNNDGNFDVTRTNWSYTAMSMSSRLEKTVLHAVLQASYTPFGVKTSIDLNLFVKTDGGKLRFRNLHDSILASACCFKLESTRLHALCMGVDGRLRESSIDLNNHYSNSGGRFRSTGSGFVSSGSNFRLKATSGSINLLGNLRYGNRVFLAEVDLALCIVNKKGKLRFERHDGALDRDGWATQAIEQLPGIGYIVAAIHWFQDNEEQSKRAVAICTNSSIVALGTAIGGYFGGAVGAVIGAGFGTSIGILVETSIKDALIDDPHVRAQFQEATVGRYLYETLRNMVTEGATTYLVTWVETLSEEFIRPFVKGLLDKMVDYGIPYVTEKTASTVLEKVIDLLRDKAVLEWDEVEKTVKELVDRKQTDPLDPDEDVAQLKANLQAARDEVQKLEARLSKVKNDLAQSKANVTSWSLAYERLNEEKTKYENQSLWCKQVILPALGRRDIVIPDTPVPPQAL